MIESALLVLEDGTKFYGQSIGALGITSGEVIFNTSMTGYQEILTDPSYFRQIVVFTYPHIGNVGVSEFDIESSRIQVSGLVIFNLSLVASNFRDVLTLSDYLIKQNVVGISNVDTRKLTCLLRDEGSKNGCIVSGSFLDESLALRTARSCDGASSRDLVREVSTDRRYVWTQGSLDICSKKIVQVDSLYHVVIYDFGVKYSIMRMLVDRGCRLTVVPAQTPAEEIISINPDGILLSSGPGDPSLCDYAIASIQHFLTTFIPMFGVCLGHQLLALASGAKVLEMKFGHHGSNHPVKDLSKNRVIITSQNHKFTIDKETLPINLQVTHISLFDGTLEGIQYVDKPVFSFQWHPEGGPGPHDSQLFFDNFIDLIKVYRDQKNRLFGYY